MKKNIFSVVLILFFVNLNIFAVEYANQEKVQEYDNKWESGHFYIRNTSDVGPYEDDGTGCKLYIDKEGIPYVFQYEMQLLYILDKNDFTIKETIKLDIPDKNSLVDRAAFLGCDGDYLRFGWYSSNMCYIDTKTFKKIFNHSGIESPVDYSYYDSETNVLFYLARNKLYCTVNPIDEAKAKDYNNHETIELLQSGKYSPHLTFENNKFYVEGIKTYIDRPFLGNYYYQLDFDWIYCQNGSSVIDLYFNLKDTEKRESVCAHPSGDIYRLVYDENADKHILYRIENTWDPQWRKQWYAEHDDLDAAVSKAKSIAAKTSSPNVAVNKSMVVKDNLRLRSSEETTSKVITIMQANTNVKVVALGKTETIDGITSAWVKVEIISGKDRDGNVIKKGTSGWCFGGYLK